MAVLLTAVGAVIGVGGEVVVLWSWGGDLVRVTDLLLLHEEQERQDVMSLFSGLISCFSSVVYLYPVPWRKKHTLAENTHTLQHIHTHTRSTETD